MNGNARHVVVMGVAGCGKSAVAAQLASRLALPLVEGDSFHPQRNIDKMRRGLPLDDEDRADWLRRLGEELAAHPGGAVLTCSALKRAYRDVLRSAVPRLRFVHLALSREASLARVSSRPDHFYPPSLVDSQFAALEDPAGEPGVAVVDATLPLDDVVAASASALTAFNNP
jgi:gluconokinase